MAAFCNIQRADRVREVFVRVRNGDVTVADLYAKDAVVTYGNGMHARRRDNIRSFCKRTIEGIHPQPEVEATLESPPLYVAVVNVSTAAGRHRAVDLFELCNGEIQSLEIYSQRQPSRFSGRAVR